MKKRFAIPIVIVAYLTVAIPTAWFLAPDHQHLSLPVMLLNYIWASACVPLFLFLTQKK